MCVYVPPGIRATIFSELSEFICNVFDFLLSLSPEAKISFCCDLNQYDFSFLSTEFDLDNIIDFPTFRNNTLDKFYCNRPTARFGDSIADNLIPTCAPPLGSVVNSHNVILISKNKITSNDSL